jgi:hypothetical protein
MLRKATFILILLFLGCSKQTTSPIERFGVLLPLAAENRWTYLEKSSESSPATIAEWSIKQTIEVDSMIFFIIDTKGFGDIQYIAKNLEEGLFFAVYDSNTVFDGQVTFKFPADSGEVYSYLVPNTDSLVTYKVVTKQITIGNDKYISYGYFNLDLNPHFPFIYFSPGIGMVQEKLVTQSFFGVDTSKFVLRQLQSYQLR